MRVCISIVSITFALLAASAAGELIDTEIEIRSGRAEDFVEAVELQREVRRRLFALAVVRAPLANDRAVAARVLRDTRGRAETFGQRLGFRARHPAFIPTAFELAARADERALPPELVALRDVWQGLFDVRAARAAFCALGAAPRRDLACAAKTVRGVRAVGVRASPGLARIRGTVESFGHGAAVARAARCGTIDFGTPKRASIARCAHPRRSIFATRSHCHCVYLDVPRGLPVFAS